MVARRVHTPEAVGSNPTSATAEPHIRGEPLESKDDEKLAQKTDYATCRMSSRCPRRSERYFDREGAKAPEHPRRQRSA